MIDVSILVMTESEMYFSISADDGDFDNDGLSDWAERKLDGFDPESDFSVEPTSRDEDFFVLLFQSFSGPSLVEINSMESEAYEVFGTQGESQHGLVRVRGMGGELGPLVVVFGGGGWAP